MVSSLGTTSSSALLSSTRISSTTTSASRTQSTNSVAVCSDTFSNGNYNNWMTYLVSKTDLFEIFTFFSNHQYREYGPRPTGFSSRQETQIWAPRRY